MTTDLPTLEREFLEKIQGARTLDDLTMVEKEIFGRKRGAFTQKMHELRALADKEKKKHGAELNRVKNVLVSALAKRRDALVEKSMEALAKEDVLDVTMDLPATACRERGHLHLIPEFMRQVEEIFGRMGFDVAYGPEIESEKYNFDLLNIPLDHPARDVMDTFWIKSSGKKKRVLRTHTSPVQIHYMKEHKPPFRMICPGKVYRKDIDATHSPMFHQFEGLMIGKDVSLRHMKGVMIAAMKELISPNVVCRFRTGYFPFTKPSMEMDIQWHVGRDRRAGGALLGRDAERRKKLEGRWLEVAGCGMVHPQVLRNVNIDPKQWQGFAFGFGVERLLMIKHQIPNIRLFYQGDLRFLRQW